MSRLSVAVFLVLCLTVAERAEHRGDAAPVSACQQLMNEANDVATPSWKMRAWHWVAWLGQAVGWRMPELERELDEYDANLAILTQAAFNVAAHSPACSARPDGDSGRDAKPG